MKNTLRIDKALSSLGITSRRNVELFLQKNTVSYNGKKVSLPGERIENLSKITINGHQIKKPNLVYFKLNKPKGYISTLKDEYNRKNIIGLVKTNARIFPIGRLDKDTHGLILLTNDGELTNRLIHPKHHIPKVYELTVLGNINATQLKSLKNGVKLEEGITNKAIAEVVNKDDKKTIIKLTIFEGKKRQIRRMCEALKINLKDLKRMEFGPIKLGDLKIGESKILTESELRNLRKVTGQISQV